MKALAGFVLSLIIFLYPNDVFISCVGFGEYGAFLLAVESGHASAWALLIRALR